MKKKVRYAIGILGTAPALGMMMPAATAAVTHTTRSVGKTVRVAHAETPLINCNVSSSRTAKSTHRRLLGRIKFDGVCVEAQAAILNKSQTGLTERTRFYSGKGALERTTWQDGNAGDNGSSSSTVFGSNPDMNAYKVCQALVANGNHNDVIYGPVCETTR